MRRTGQREPSNETMPVFIKLIQIVGREIAGCLREAERTTKWRRGGGGAGDPLTNSETPLSRHLSHIITLDYK